MLRFSVVIPTYNYAHYLPRALNSAMAQENAGHEIIVIDDGSTDGTAELVQACKNNYSGDLRYEIQPHQGLGAARNRGVRVSGGDYLLFLDADDALFPAALDRLRKVLAANGNADFVTAGRVTVDTRGRPSAFYPKPLSRNNHRNVASYLLDRVIPIVNGGIIIHRRVFSTLEFPETVRLWEDRVFHAHLLALFRGVSLAEPILTMYRHSDSLSHNLNFMKTDGVKTIDLIFDPAVLPMDLMELRAEYAGKIQLELFQMYYARGRYEEACAAFRAAWRSSPKRAMRVKVLRRYLKMNLLRYLQRDRTGGQGR